MPAHRGFTTTTSASVIVPKFVRLPIYAVRPTTSLIFLMSLLVCNVYIAICIRYFVCRFVTFYQLSLIANSLKLRVLSYGGTENTIWILSSDIIPVSNCQTDGLDVIIAWSAFKKLNVRQIIEAGNSLFQQIRHELNVIADHKFRSNIWLKRSVT